MEKTLALVQQYKDEKQFIDNLMVVVQIAVVVIAAISFVVFY